MPLTKVAVNLVPSVLLPPCPLAPISSSSSSFLATPTIPLTLYFGREGSPGFGVNDSWLVLVVFPTTMASDEGQGISECKVRRYSRIDLLFFDNRIGDSCQTYPRCRAEGHRKIVSVLAVMEVLEMSGILLIPKHSLRKLAADAVFTFLTISYVSQCKSS